MQLRGLLPVSHAIYRLLPQFGDVGAVVGRYSKECAGKLPARALGVLRTKVVVADIQPGLLKCLVDRTRCFFIRTQAFKQLSW
jgi:hypothetical protein